MSALTKAKAQAAYDAVMAKYAPYFEPMKFDDGEVLDPLYGPDDKPVLQEPGVQCSGWAIVWEEGPDEWVYQVSSGGSTEEERVLLAAANEEFGGDVKADEPPPTAMPAGVFCEPVNHVVLGLYPA